MNFLSSAAMKPFLAVSPARLLGVVALLGWAANLALVAVSMAILAVAEFRAWMRDDDITLPPAELPEPTSSYAGNRLLVDATAAGDMVGAALGDALKTLGAQCSTVATTGAQLAAALS